MFPPSESRSWHAARLGSIPGSPGRAMNVLRIPHGPQSPTLLAQPIMSLPEAPGTPSSLETPWICKQKVPNKCLFVIVNLLELFYYIDESHPSYNNRFQPLSGWFIPHCKRALSLTTGERTSLNQSYSGKSFCRQSSPDGLGDKRGQRPRDA